jgi:Fibronectin type III domain
MDGAEGKQAVPGAPQRVAVIPADGAAVVTWHRPAHGDQVTRYEVMPVHDQTPLRERRLVVDGAAASVLLRGLLNGVTYTARVTAWHNGHEGPPALSEPFEPCPAPDAPVSIVAVAGEQSATVRWTEPGGGGPAQRYRVVATPADVPAFEAPAGHTSALVAGLRNRRRYTFTVEAQNGAGGNVSSPSNPVWPGDDVPGYLFPLELSYLMVLGALAYLYALRSAIVLGPLAIPVLRDAVPGSVAGVPVSIPWFGALGAVLIGLYGIFDHSHRDWDRALNRWHVARPFTGAVLGTVGFITFTAVLRATGLTPSSQDSLGKLVYFAIAFVVGFREETFRQLVKRVADLIVGPGWAPPPSLSRAVSAQPLPRPPAPPPPPEPR